MPGVGGARENACRGSCTGYGRCAVCGNNAEAERLHTDTPPSEMRRGVPQHRKARRHCFTLPHGSVSTSHTREMSRDNVCMCRWEERCCWKDRGISFFLFFPSSSFHGMARGRLGGGGEGTGEGWPPSPRGRLRLHISLIIILLLDAWCRVRPGGMGPGMVGRVPTVAQGGRRYCRQCRECRRQGEGGLGAWGSFCHGSEKEGEAQEMVCPS